MILGKHARRNPHEEISDREASFRFDLLQNADRTKQKQIATLGEVMNHPRLYANYPELKKIPIFAQRVDNSDLIEGGWQGGKSRIRIEVPDSFRGVNDPAEIKRQIALTLVHETQHAVQLIDGRSRGSNEMMWRKAAFMEFQKSPAAQSKKDDPAFQQGLAAYEMVFIRGKGKAVSGPLNQSQVKELRSEIKSRVDEIAHGLYMQDPGEVEARNTAAKFIGAPLEPIPTRNVRELPGAPTLSLALDERITTFKLKLTRAASPISELGSQAPNRVRYEEIATAGPSSATKASPTKALKKSQSEREKSPELEGNYKVALKTLDAVVEVRRLSPEAAKRVKAEATQRLSEMQKGGIAAPTVRAFDARANRQMPRELERSKDKTRQVERER